MAANTDPVTTGHAEFVKFAGELIGVTVLVIFADMSEDIGKIAVVLMSGWFLIFLITNATELQGLVRKV